MFPFNKRKQNQIIEEEDDDFNEEKSPSLTLKLSISGGNFELFQYILEKGSPFYSNDDTFEDCIDTILSDKVKPENKTKYLKELFQSSIFKKWIFDQYLGQNFNVSCSICMLGEVELIKDPQQSNVELKVK